MSNVLPTRHPSIACVLESIKFYSRSSEMKSLCIEFGIAERLIDKKGGEGVKSLLLSVPSKGYCLLAGESPAMAKARSHVAWMAGDGGNAVFWSPSTKSAIGG